MGELFGFMCKNCNYKVTTVASEGVIMTGEFIPYVCNTCGDIEDVFFDMFEEIKPFYLDGTKDYPLCSKCKKEMRNKWNVITKPCPKCKSNTLEIDPEAESLMID